MKHDPELRWPKLLKPETAAKYLDISLSSFERHVRPGLTEKRIGGTVRFNRSEIDKMFDPDTDEVDTTSEGVALKEAALARL